MRGCEHLHCHGRSTRQFRDDPVFASEIARYFSVDPVEVQASLKAADQAEPLFRRGQDPNNPDTSQVIGPIARLLEVADISGDRGDLVLGQLFGGICDDPAPTDRFRAIDQSTTASLRPDRAIDVVLLR